MAQPIAPAGRTFRLRAGYKFKCILDIAWPVTALVAIALIYLLIIRPSRGQMVEFDFKYKDFMPLIVPCLVAWLVWDVYKIQRAFRFKVVLSDEGVRVGGESAGWSDIAAAEMQAGFNWRPAAVLHRRDSVAMRIPAALDGIDEVREIIRRKFPASEQE